jgi:type II secretory pathway pseudopilin PulG
MTLPRNAHRRLRGITLVETLIAMTVVTLAAAGALTACAQASAAFHVAATEQRLHERAQYAFATLESDLQMAGYFAGAAVPESLAVTTLPASALACGTTLFAQFNQPIQILNRYTLRCAARGGAVRGAQVLSLRRVSARMTDADPGRLQWLSVAGSPLPGTLYSGARPLAAATPAPSAMERHNLILRSYYVSRGSDGDPLTPALRVKSLSSVARSPAFIDTEVMSGVENLQTELWPSATAPRALRVTLALRSDAQEVRAGEPLRRVVITRHFALRNAAAFLQ